MNRAPDPMPQPDKSTCGNCCNAVKSSRAVGRVLCTALPPQVMQRPGGMAANIYPEMDADKLGCTTLWNVNAGLFHILAQAVTLATQPASNDNADQSTQGSAEIPPGAGGAPTT